MIAFFRAELTDRKGADRQRKTRHRDGAASPG
jgi:hypothetical protein